MKCRYYELFSIVNVFLLFITKNVSTEDRILE